MAKEIKQKQYKRMSEMFIKTLREAPAEAELVSHQLMIRAGLIKQLASGIYSYLPLFYRVLRKIEEILRQEMDAIGGQEINMPVVHSADLWKESGRYQQNIDEMLKFRDRREREMLLAMTHEEVVTDIVRFYVDSYKQLPFMLYQIQTKFRDEARSRGGLIRVREFVMKDGYSFHRDNKSMEEYYPRVVEAYKRIYTRAGLEDALMVEGDSGMMGGDISHEFMHETEVGEDSLAVCSACHYAANSEVANAYKGQHLSKEERDKLMLPLEDVFTPDSTEVAAVASFLSVAEDQILKTLVYIAEDKPILLVMRGDLNLNETKLAKVLRTDKFRPANAEELETYNLIGGFVSPCGKKLPVIADDSVLTMVNMICGGDKLDYHRRNVNLDRDFKFDKVADITAVTDGSLCPLCHAPLRLTRGIEIGNIFNLGTKYSEAMGAVFADIDGTSKPFIMGCYGIGVGRMAASVVEKHHDDKGIIWPVNIAPYHIVVMPIGKEGSPAFEAAVNLANDLAQHFEVLLDDRDLRNGVKFNDLDLLGFPMRIVIGPKGLESGEAELKWRRDSSSFNLPLNEVVNYCLNEMHFDVTLY